MSGAPLRPHPVLLWRCLPAQRFCRSSLNIFTQMSLPPLKVISRILSTHFDELLLMMLNLQTAIRLRGTGFIALCLCSIECLNVEFVCNVLVVADQLLITRLKEMCEVVITENCTCIFFPILPGSISHFAHIFILCPLS